MNRTKALTNVKTLRVRAREHIEDGAVPARCTVDRSEIARPLNETLATEIVSVLRYRRHHFMTRGIDAMGTAAAIVVYSNQEQEHAGRIAVRIVQLSGEPDFAPNGLASGDHGDNVADASLVKLIVDDLVAERIAIDSYRETIRQLG